MASQLAFRVLCLRSPARALKKRRLVKWNGDVGKWSGFQIQKRDPASDDPLPGPSWQDRVVVVVEARGKFRPQQNSEPLTEWLVEIAIAAGGALYDPRNEEFSYIEEVEATKRAKQLVAVGDVARLAAWIRAAAPESEVSAQWQTIDTIRDAVVPEIERTKRHLAKPTARRPRLDATQACSVAVELQRVYGEDRKFEDLVIATAAHSTDEQHAAIAATLTKNREDDEDLRAPAPKTVAQLLGLFEGIVAGDERSQRRFDRFFYYERDAIVRLARKALDVGDPSLDVAAAMVSAIPVGMLDRSVRERLLTGEKTTALARAFRDAAIAHRDAAGQRAAEYSQRRFEEYERYRNDPLVVTPRRRGEDLAMFRPLNDALYGPERDRPQLPERVVALLCDRRIDEAREVYIAALGELHADAAIRDALEFFAPTGID